MKRLDPATAARAAASANPKRPAMAIIHDTPDVRLVVFRVAPGQEVSPHRSTSSVLLAVTAGSGFITGDDGGASVERPCVAGDVIAFEPGELHGMRAVADELLLLAVIAPRPGSR